MSPFYVPFKIGSIQSYEPFTHNIKKIKVAAHKNGDVDGTCKQALTLQLDVKCKPGEKLLFDDTATGNFFFTI